MRISGLLLQHERKVASGETAIVGVNQFRLEKGRANGNIGCDDYRALKGAPTHKAM